MKDSLHRFVSKMIEHQFTIDETTDMVEKVYIEKILEMSGHNISEAARQMQMHRNTLSRKIKSLGIRE